jgi:hypothetical protein
MQEFREHLVVVSVVPRAYSAPSRPIGLPSSTPTYRFVKGATIQGRADQSERQEFAGLDHILDESTVG